MAPDPEMQDQSGVEACWKGLSALTQIIRLHDQDLWQVSDPPFAKLRHIHTHLSKCTGQLAGIVEPLDHFADSHGDSALASEEWAEDLAPIVADLLIHAAQLADLANLDIGDALRSRWQRNAAKFAPSSEFAALVASP